MPKNILVLHGPNLNLLGEREGDDETLTLAVLDRQLQSAAKALGVTLKIRQTNHEGVLIDTLHAERAWADGVVLNPGALAHYAYTLRDAIAAIKKPVFEVHLSDLMKREAFRRTSVLKDVCAGTVMGKGAGSYLSALEQLAGNGKTAAGSKGTPVKVSTAPPPASKPGKTIGRKAAARPPVDDDEASAESKSGKTIGRGRSASGASSAGTNGLLTRRLVRQKIAERLQGKLTPAGLSTWARTQFLEVQRGAPAEQGQRELLEETLQSLTLSAVAASRLSDEQLVELMAQLGE